MKIGIIALSIGLPLCIHPAIADLTGRVLDKEGRPLAGVSLFVMNGYKQDVTDAAGRFALPIDATGIRAPARYPVKETRAEKGPSVFDPVAKRDYTPQEWSDLDSEKKASFIFCGKNYYETYKASDNCGETPTRNVGSVQSDLEFMELVSHEYGHTIGTGNELPDANGVPVRADVLFGRISFAADPQINSHVNDTLPHLRPDFKDEFISLYASKNGLEDFAECITAYVMMGRVFRNRAASNPFLSQKYQFLKSRIFKGREYDTGDLSLYRKWIEDHSEVPWHPLTPTIFGVDYRWDYAYPILGTTP